MEEEEDEERDCGGCDGGEKVWKSSWLSEFLD